MGREAKEEHHPYIKILLDHGLRSDGKTRGFQSLYDVEKDLGLPRQRLYACSNRGVHDIRVMAELASLFRLPEEVYLSEIKRYAKDLLDQYTLSSKAS